MSHLHALEMRLSNTRIRHSNCKPHQSVFWLLQISGIEKEIKHEYAFLGMPYPPISDALTEEKILAELLP